MAFYKSLKSTLADVDTRNGTKNSSFKIFKSFTKEMKKTGKVPILLRVYMDLSSSMLLFDFAKYELKTSWVEIPYTALLNLNANNWGELIVVNEKLDVSGKELIWDSCPDEDVPKESTISTKVTVNQHIPDWCVGEIPATIKDVDLDDVLKLDFVARWQGGHFIRFMKSTDSDFCYLMVEVKDKTSKCGKSFWVLATLTPFDVAKTINLPEWDLEDYN